MHELNGLAAIQPLNKPMGMVYALRYEPDWSQIQSFPKGTAGNKLVLEVKTFVNEAVAVDGWEADDDVMLDCMLNMVKSHVKPEITNSPASNAIFEATARIATTSRRSYGNNVYVSLLRYYHLMQNEMVQYGLASHGVTVHGVDGLDYDDIIASYVSDHNQVDTGLLLTEHDGYKQICAIPGWPRYYSYFKYQ